MDTIKCVVCGKELKKDAEICQRCGADTITWMPTKQIMPNRRDGLVIGIVASVLGVAGAWAGLWIIGAPLVGFGIWFLCLAIRNSKEDKRLYNLAQTDYEAYIVETHKRFEKLDNDFHDRLAHTPACPICGSKDNVIRISNIDRTVSTAALGLASSSIGKQWECRACSHKFNVDVAAAATTPQPVTIPRPEPKPVSPDPATELRKYKQLLDDGVITQEDFDQKKKQLLGL